MIKIDFYTLLGVERDATAAQIKAAWQRAAMHLHPDKLPASITGIVREAAERSFKWMSEAYRTLSDTEQRDAYDAMLDATVFSDSGVAESQANASGVGVFVEGVAGSVIDNIFKPEVAAQVKSWAKNVANGFREGQKARAAKRSRNRSS